MFQNVNAFIAFYLTLVLFPALIPFVHFIIDLIVRGASWLVAPLSLRVSRTPRSLSLRSTTE